jgi:hypothetical protein
MIDEVLLDRRLKAMEARLWTLEGTLQHVIAEIKKKGDDADLAGLGDELDDVSRGVGALEAEVENVKSDVEDAIVKSAGVVASRVLDCVPIMIAKSQERPRTIRKHVVRDANHRITDIIETPEE